ncbi:MAG TPA: FAD-linked oxidase C-terminal domain-containing protein [Pseudonocardiaceae bacterium]|nr:FAD-linked oxidase C-terminal domain-containing protein [Pseudonocardiaceae bacterium]
MTVATKELVAELRAAVGEDCVVTDADVTASYARDMMPLAPSGIPAAVVFPRDTGQVQAAVRVCGAHRTPIVPRGAGSGLSGAANAIDGCVVLCLARMKRIIEVDPENRLAVVEPGVVNLDLREAVEKEGLFYPPDPSSYDWCTIGGNLATNAGGLCCVKYGVTTDSVLGLEVVLADGRLLRTGRRTVKGVAGYDLTKLFIGSEGTLGVITKATLTLRPLPQAPATLVASFRTTGAAGRAVITIVREGLVPSLMEIMDRTSIRAVQNHQNTELGMGADSAALLICQSDAGGEAARHELAAIEQACNDAGADLVYATGDLAEGRLLLAARRAVLPALETLGTWLTDDVCVPRNRIAELIEGSERIANRLGLTIAVVGHAGDGNMHPTIVYDASSPDETRRAHEAFDEILEVGLGLGGTVTGEHGIGRIKQDWLEREIGEVGIDVHRRLKAALDPENLFNPGSMFSPTGRDLLDT